MDPMDPMAPVPAEAILVVLDGMLKECGDEWDQPPEWGFLYAPPLSLTAEVAEEVDADVSAVRGVMAAPVALPLEAWRQFGSPLELVGMFAALLKEPDSDRGAAIVRKLRSTAPVMGAWLRVEAWAPPVRLEAEYARRRRAGKDMDLSVLPDRLESRVAWAADAWGRNFVGRRVRDSDEFEWDWTEPGRDRLSAHHPALVHLRTMVDAVATPLPTV
jgi:hypothetical protein